MRRLKIFIALLILVYLAWAGVVVRKVVHTHFAQPQLCAPFNPRADQNSEGECP